MTLTGLYVLYTILIAINVVFWFWSHDPVSLMAAAFVFGMLVMLAVLSGGEQK